MDSPMEPDTTFHQSPMADLDTLVNAAARESAFPLPQTTSDNPSNPPIAEFVKAESSLAGVFLGRCPRYDPYNPPPLPKRGPIYNVPTEIILRIFQLVASPRTRDGLYDLLELTHVCRFWRAALMNQPQLWSTVFITQKDRRSFVEACIERSHPVALDVKIDAREMGPVRLDCECDKGGWGRLLPSETNPCEWHFQFESLAETKHSNRIRALDIDFDGMWEHTAKSVGKVRLGLGGCRFFTSSFPHLTTLMWKNEEVKSANHLFTTSPFSLTLRSLTYVGPWDGLPVPVNNLTSFAFESDLGLDGTDAEDVRLFLLNNRSLESLTLKHIEFRGDLMGPPVPLSNLKSLIVNFPEKKLSTIIHVPALRCLSSLRIGSDDPDYYTLHATGDGITFSVGCFPSVLAETWENITGHAKPTIRHVHLDDSGPWVEPYGSGVTFVSLLLDAHTLEIGDGYFPFWYDGFLDDLKQLGPQLKIIRFAISEELEPFPEDDDSLWDGELLDSIEDLVRYRFHQGRPLSAVERMVTNKGERANREQDFIWRCFYNDREICKYVQPR